MDGKGFQVWLSAARGLTRAQRREALAVQRGRIEVERGPALSALLEQGAVRGMARGLRRPARAAAGPSTRERSTTRNAGAGASLRRGRR